MAHITLDTTSASSTHDTTAQAADEVRPPCLFHFRGCVQPGEFEVAGVARMCLMHFLADRVRLNLGVLDAHVA